MRLLDMLPRAFPVRAILLMIAATAAVPTLVFSGILLLQYAASQHSRSEYELEESAKGVARAIDSEFAAAEAVLRVLLSSRLLVTGDIDGFETRLRQSTAKTGRHFALIAPNGQYVFNTILPPGAPLPRVNPGLWEPVFHERRTHITNVIQDMGGSGPWAGIGVPVIRNGEVAWVFASFLSAKDFSGVLSAPGVPQEWIVSIVDRNGVHLVRSHRSEEFAGRPLAQPLIEHIAQGATGTLRNTSLEGIPVVSTIAYASNSKWATAIGFPVALLEAPLRATLWEFILSGTVVVAAALLLVFLLGRHLHRALLALSGAAQRVGDGHAVVPARSQVSEINTVAAVLEQVSQKLHASTAHLEALVGARTAELSQANEKLIEAARQRADIEAQIRQMQKIEAVGQLTGGIAHDFNNMLAIILGSLRLLQRRMERGDGNIQKYIDAATQGAERAAKLTARLLAFSRQQPLAPEAVDVGKLVVGTGEILRQTIPENIEIEAVPADGLWRVRVDQQALESVIINLAGNARDAMPDGGTLTIETANADLDEAYVMAHPEVSAGQYVMIALSDTGMGMSADVMARAFDPFFTTKATGEGTGLGLSQAHGFIRQSNGHIKLYSAPGRGTTVKLYLPRYIGETDMSAPPQSAATSLPMAQDHETILIVEDEAEVRRLTVEMIQELGYVVLAAGGGAEGLKLLDAHPEVALVITDVVMPGMNGRQLADEIKMRRPALPVLFTTGYVPTAIFDGGIPDSGVCFITKPHTIETLAVKVHEQLRIGAAKTPLSGGSDEKDPAESDAAGV